jgi:hypothetical protein
MVWKKLKLLYVRGNSSIHNLDVILKMYANLSEKCTQKSKPKNFAISTNICLLG